MTASWSRWRTLVGDPRRLRASAVLLATCLGTATVVARVWYPEPPVSLAVRFLAALTLLAVVVALAIRLERQARDGAMGEGRLPLAPFVVLAVGGGLIAWAGPSLLITLAPYLQGIVATTLAGLAAVLIWGALAVATMDLDVVVVSQVPAATVAAPADRPRAAAGRSLRTSFLVGGGLVLLLMAVVAVTVTLARSGAPWLQAPAEVPRQPALVLRPTVATGAAQPMPLTDMTAMAVREVAGPGATGQPALADARGLAIGPNGSVYVVETAAGRVAVFDSTGKFSRAIGSRGDGAGQFKEPVGVAVGPDGTVFVADAERNTIEVFDASGRHQRTLAEGLSLYRPRALAVGDDGQLYVADTGRNRALVLDLSGVATASVPANYAQMPARVEQPTAAVGVGGVVYLAEPMRGQLVRFRPGDQAVEPALAITRTETVVSARLTAGPRGAVVLAEVGQRRAVIICGGGTSFLAWRLPEAFEDVRAAALDQTGNLWVVDAAGRLLVVRLEATC